MFTELIRFFVRRGVRLYGYSIFSAGWAELWAKIDNKTVCVVFHQLAINLKAWPSDDIDEHEH